MTVRFAATTLTGVLDEAADRWPDTALTLHGRAGPEALPLAELAAASRELAGGLRAAGVAPGAPVGLLFPNSLDFVTTLFAILRAGAIPAPLALPAARDPQASIDRLRAIAAHAEMRQVVVASPLAPMVSAFAVPGLEVLSPGAVRAASPGELDASGGPDDLALVQYTSGSTSAPKGVALAHRAICAGLRAIAEGMALSCRDINAQWLPLQHDMGLIGLLAGISQGTPSHIWTPGAFVKDPAGWLARFAALGASVYAGPSFSYEVLLDAVDDDQLAALDLSRWRVAFNGAEPIDAGVLDRFASRFARAGLRQGVMFPVYGLAEATLAVSFPALGAEPRVVWIDRDRLGSERRAVPVPRQHPRARASVSVGRAVLGLDIRIAGAGGERHVGEVEVRGASLMTGYYRSPELTRDAVRDGGWLRTGDLGFIDGGELYITGRIKELIIVRGAKIYPADVEALVRPLPGVHRDGCAAFGLGATGSERIGVIVETAVGDSAGARQLERRARARLLEHLGAATEIDLYLVPPRTVPRTTSGKLQRVLVKERLLSGALRDHLLTTRDHGDA